MKRAALLAIVGMLVAAEAAAQEFGRLFFTPEQRVALDARRKARVPDKPAAVAVVASPTTRVNGYVKRTQGPSTVFLNGQGLAENPQADSPRTPRGGDPRVTIPVGEAGARVELKPGEILDRGSGEVRDVLGTGQIQVRRDRPGK